MKFVVTIDTSGEAFQGHDNAAAQEVARILKGIAQAAEYGMLGDMELVDSTGRDCGDMKEVE